MVVFPVLSVQQLLLFRVHFKNQGLGAGRTRLRGTRPFAGGSNPACGSQAPLDSRGHSMGKDEPPGKRAGRARPFQARPSFVARFNVSLAIPIRAKETEAS